MLDAIINVIHIQDCFPIITLTLYAFFDPHKLMKIQEFLWKVRNKHLQDA